MVHRTDTEPCIPTANVRTRADGYYFLHEATLTAAGRAVANTGDERFAEDLLELFNLIEAVCLKERFLIPSLVERRLPDNGVVATLSGVNKLLAPVTISAALVHIEDSLRKLSSEPITRTPDRRPQTH